MLWSPETPTLYKLVTTVEADGKIVDRKETEFGIRTVAFDKDKGFLLNGKPYVLKGTCNHQDMPGVGAALPDALQYFRIARLKELGCNAYRTSHNPPTPELLDACDRLGCWSWTKTACSAATRKTCAGWNANPPRPQSSQRRHLVHRQRGSACRPRPRGGRVARTMQDYVHRLDPTRPVTMAAPEGNTSPASTGSLKCAGGIITSGRTWTIIMPSTRRSPNVGTEQASTVCTRGIYDNDTQRGYVSAYDDNAPHWAHTTETWWNSSPPGPGSPAGLPGPALIIAANRRPTAGRASTRISASWTPAAFPRTTSTITRPGGANRPMVHLLPHWTWPGKEGQEIDVRCFSNCEEVEVFLNGQSLGRQAMPRNSHLRWKVKYAPGTLSAKGFKAGQVVAEDKVETTGAPAALKLTPDRPGHPCRWRRCQHHYRSRHRRQGRVVPVARQPGPTSS